LPAKSRKPFLRFFSALNMAHDYEVQRKQEYAEGTLKLPERL